MATNGKATPFYRLIYFDINRANEKILRILLNPRLIVRQCRGHRACGYCKALRTAVLKLPGSWQKKLAFRPIEAGSICPQIYCEDVDDVIKLRVRSTNSQTMSNALSTLFKPKKQRFVPRMHQQDLADRLNASDNKCSVRESSSHSDKTINNNNKNNKGNTNNDNNNSNNNFLMMWDMGSGKTAGAAYALRDAPFVSVICEKTLVDYWVNAFTQMGIRPQVEVWTIAVRAYQRAQDKIKYYRGSALVVDEIQHFKNFYHTTGADMVAEITKAGKRKTPLLCLSGTPLLNNAFDILYLLAVFAPKEQLTRHIWDVVDTKKQPHDGAAMSEIVKNWHGGEEAVVAEFGKALQCHVHFYSPRVFTPRSYKKHYPELIEKPVRFIPLTWEQVLCYFYYNDGAHVNLNKISVSSGSSKGGVMRQLGVTSSAELENKYFSSKTDAIVAAIARKGPDVSESEKNNQKSSSPTPKNEKAAKKRKKYVVYSGLKERTLKPVQNLLRKKHPELRVALLDGNVTEDGARQKMLDDYIHGKIDVLLICRVGAVGLDLQGTSEIHLMESQLNTATENQIFARAIRYSPKQPQPPQVEAVRYIGTFPDATAHVSTATKKNLTNWLRSMPKVIRDDLGNDWQGVIKWLKAKLKENAKKGTADEKQYEINQAKQTELRPLIEVLRSVSLLQPPSKKPRMTNKKPSTTKKICMKKDVENRSKRKIASTLHQQEKKKKHS